MGEDDRPPNSSGRSSSTSKARATRPRATASTTEVIGCALLPNLTERRIIEHKGFPLMRHLRAVVAEGEPLDMPWSSFFGTSRSSGN